MEPIRTPETKPAPMRAKISRRSFIKSAALAGGSLVLGIGLPSVGFRKSAHAAMGTEISAWVVVNPDESVILRASQTEMGQGPTMGNLMMFAEEFECKWENVRHEFATGRREYVNPLFGIQGTGGSTATPGFWDVMRKAGAQAREMFVQAAAQQWGVKAEECQARDGMITHGSGKSLSYGKLAEAAAKIPPPAEVKLKRPSEFRLIGRPVNRLDSMDKVTGKAVYAMDVNVPGMLTAAIKHAPFGGKVESFDAAAAKRVKGVHDVFVVGGAVYPDNSAPALLCAADTYWQAVQGLKAANPVFERNGWEKLDSDLVTRTFQEGAKEKGKLARVQGDVNTALASAAKVIEVDYEVPYLSHSPMEPMTSAADVKADSCEIWAGTQGADPCYFMASKLTGLPLEKIKVHMTYAGGGFGRRFETDVAEQAIEASMKLKKPVKVIWSREEDTQHDYNRPAFFGRITAGVDEKGNVVAWRYNTVGPAIWLSPYQSTRAKDLDAESDFMKGMRQTGVDFHSVQGAKDIGYAFPNLEVTYVQKDFPVPIAFYRAVGNTQHAFFVESALDEIAQATGQDPYQLRRKLLAKEPRMLGVLDLAAQKAGWGQPLPAGRFRGIAFHNSFDSPVADVIEISVRGGKRIQVHRVVRAIDCGIVVNPDQLQAQFQGGLAWGLTTAMYSELTLKNGEVVQSNFHDYKMLRISQMPVFEAYAVPSQANPTGIGEPVAVSVAPALANAVFAATGKRIRSLPLAKHGFSLA